MDAIEKLRRSFEDCTRCGLSETRTHVVFGEGNPKAEIMLIGEAPGKNEDEQNRPFIGMAGKLLNDLLEKIGMSREAVFIANVVKCRPPENRNPSAEEIKTCLPYLWQQVDLIRPRIIGTLGNFAAHAVLGQKVAITKVRGRHYYVKNVLVVPMLHPAAALHQGNLRPALLEDFQNLKKIIAAPRKTPAGAEQTGLFPG
ncbi:MAG TPA: uracil-DNA glycosylase [Nitrospiria bacterium]